MAQKQQLKMAQLIISIDRRRPAFSSVFSHFPEKTSREIFNSLLFFFTCI